MLNREKDIKRSSQALLEKAIGEVVDLLDRSNAKLANPSFVDRAPAEIVAKEREKVVGFEARLAKLREQLEQLG